MINYYFFQFIKKDRTVDRPVRVRPPRANDETGSIFSNLDRLGPDRVDRRPSGFGPDRPGTDRLQYSS
jgi:hypothetical protein